MFLRRAENLGRADAVIVDGALWNVARVTISDDDRVELRLTRGVDFRVLKLRRDDLVICSV